METFKKTLNTDIETCKDLAKGGYEDRTSFVLKGLPEFMSEQKKLLNEFVQQQQRIMYGEPWERLRFKFDNMTIEELKEVDINTENATVSVSGH